jgi:Holliday junction resolvase
MTRYQDGTRFEHVVRKQLEEDGYWCTRSAGSKTKVDLVAIKPGQVLLVQCKRDGRCAPAERAAIVSLAQCLPLVAVPVLAWKHVGSTAILLDRITGLGPKDRAPFVTDEVGTAAALVVM